MAILYRLHESNIVITQIYKFVPVHADGVEIVCKDIIEDISQFLYYLP